LCAARSLLLQELPALPPGACDTGTQRCDEEQAMKQRYLVRSALALIAFGAGLACAQTGLSRNLNAGSTAAGAASAGGALPQGTGDNGRAIVVITQSPNGANVMGAGAAPPRGALSAVDIAAMFLSADANHDGELSRAEAQSIRLPMGFDDIDTNHDGVISRFEYDEAFR
jgi:hypothetical protein